jgi:hypothetical protein
MGVWGDLGRWVWEGDGGEGGTNLGLCEHAGWDHFIWPEGLAWVDEGGEDFAAFLALGWNVVSFSSGPSHRPGWTRTCDRRR